MWDLDKAFSWPCLTYWVSLGVQDGRTIIFGYWFGLDWRLDGMAWNERWVLYSVLGYYENDEENLRKG